MKMRSCFILAMVLLVAAAPAIAIISQPATVIDSGGGISNSPQYENLSAIGQPVVGLSTGAGGSNHAGFIPVLGANGLLWPVIGFDPATITFTFFVSYPAPDSQNLSITNKGSSTLEWQVARTQAWLSLTPLNGSIPGSGAVSVSIIPANLPGGVVPGIYADTITITGTGADNSDTTIPVTLTVTQGYTLTVTFGTPAPPILPGSGMVYLNPQPPMGDAFCSPPDLCQRTYPDGMPVTLSAIPDGNSQASWSGDCKGGACSVTMDKDHVVTATFSFIQPAMIVGNPNYYTSLQAAYKDALPGQTIKARQYTFVENLILDQARGGQHQGGVRYELCQPDGLHPAPGETERGEGVAGDGPADGEVGNIYLRMILTV